MAATFTCAECGAPAEVVQQDGQAVIRRECSHEGVIYAHITAVMTGKAGMAKDAGIR